MLPCIYKKGKRCQVIKTQTSSQPVSFFIKTVHGSCNIASTPKFNLLFDQIFIITIQLSYFKIQQNHALTNSTIKTSTAANKPCKLQKYLS